MYQLYKCDSHMLLLSKDIDLELHILMLKISSLRYMNKDWSFLISWNIINSVSLWPKYKFIL